MGTAKILESVRKLKNVDGWVNLLTGLGVRGRDKQVSTSVEWSPLGEYDVDNLYAQDAISAKIVDLLPEEAFRKGYDIKNLEPKDLDILWEAINRTYFNEKLVDTAKLARAYGGAAIVPLSKDTKGMESPYVIGAEIIAFRAFNRYELQPQIQTQDTDLSSVDFGKIMQFQLQPRGLMSTYNLYIHRSRMGIMMGTKLPSTLSARNQYWGDSVLTRLMPALQGYATAHDAASNVLSDFRIALFKIKGLSTALASDADDLIIKRLEMLNLSRSVARTVLLDADGEDFEYREASLSGVDSLINKTEDRLVAESEYPHTVLLGESPNGSNATGNSTMTSWYNFVASYQVNEIKPVLLPMLQRLAAGLGIKNYEKIDVEFFPLWEMDEKEQSDIRKSQAEVDQIYMQNSVIDPREVATSRFGDGGYSTDTIIDMSLREQKTLTPEVSVAAKPVAPPAAV